MTDANSQTPRSNSDTQPLLKAPKDKNCPFCGQAFTSSSLGRHLDLYIRAKNPKPPDGVHIVDEIRKIRGGITRRQAKGSLKKDGSTPVPGKKHSIGGGEDSSALVDSPEADDDGLDVGKSRQSFKDVHWGHPSRALGTKTPEVRRDMSRQLQKADLDQRHRMSDEAETAKATEMALRELLKSVREANAKASGPGLFDFDPYTLNFPSLCLQILPAPSTLFSPTPFPTNESWSISPPGQKQLEALNRQVRERLLAHQRQKQINQAYPFGVQSNASSAANSPLPTPPLPDPDPQKLFHHIADAYQHWMNHSEKTRQEYWQVEILRAFARSTELRRESEMQLENARREIEYLKANRWTSGAADVSPINIHFGGSETVKELGKHGMDFRNWDYDRLIEKWKSVVRESKTNSSGLVAQKPLPTPVNRSFSMANLSTQPFSASSSAQSVKIESAPYSAPPTTNGTEPGSDQVDAEGEDDDAEVDLDATAVSEEDPMSAHGHTLPLQPTPIHPQMHAHIQSQVQAQAQAQAQVHTQMHQQQQQQQQHMQQQAMAMQHAQNQQAQAWAAARQHMNQSRNQHHHQHQQLSPHPQHMGSAGNSRRPSAVLLDHGMSTGGMLPMDGIEHQDQFLRMDMGLTSGFVGSNADGV